VGGSIKKSEIIDSEASYEAQIELLREIYAKVLGKEVKKSELLTLMAMMKAVEGRKLTSDVAEKINQIVADASWKQSTWDQLAKITSHTPGTVDSTVFTGFAAPPSKNLAIGNVSNWQSNEPDIVIDPNMHGMSKFKGYAEVVNVVDRMDRSTKIGILKKIFGSK